MSKRGKSTLVLVPNFQQHTIRPACDQPTKKKKKKIEGDSREANRQSKNQQHVQSIFELDKLSRWRIWRVSSFSGTGDFLCSGKNNTGEKGLTIVMVIYWPFDVYPWPVAMALPWWSVMTMSGVDICGRACAEVPHKCWWGGGKLCLIRKWYIFI